MIAVIPPQVLNNNIIRLTNQMWKLIPMKENHEKWEQQLESVLNELIGIEQMYLIADENFLILLSKLKGLKTSNVSFEVYRSTVFKCISLLREVFKNEQY